ncbi:hypothetical protein ACWF94_11555 [Streptomyces sp. NPDC055078]
MSPRHGRRPATTEQQGHGGPVLHPGTTREAWCVSCRAWTGITCEMHLLTPEGVSTSGALAWCEVCEDPTNPLPARRIDRG